MDQNEIDRILKDEPDPERAKLRLEARLQLERLKLERETADREEERHNREKRRWFANPLLVAVSVGAVSLIGDFVVSSLQGRQAILLQQQQASSDLVVSVFSDEADQSIDNLRFMIEAGLVQDPDGQILAAAQEFRPRATVPTAAPPPMQPGVFAEPRLATARVLSVTDGDTVRLDLGATFTSGGDGPVPRISASGTVSLSLAGIDAPEIHMRNCHEGARQAQEVWGERAKAWLEDAVGLRDGDPPVVEVLLIEVDSFGRARGLIAPPAAVNEPPRAVFAKSHNLAMVRQGLAVPSTLGPLPDFMIADLQVHAARAEEAGQGMHAAMSRSIDLSAADRDVLLPPFLYRRICDIGPDDDPNAHLADYFGRVEIRDLATQAEVAPADLYRVDGRTITLLRPLSSVSLSARGG